MANGIKRGDVVTLIGKFKTGSTDPKEKRIYPAGTRGVVSGAVGNTFKVVMDDPPGVLYKEKIIFVNKGSVKV